MDKSQLIVLHKDDLIGKRIKVGIYEFIAVCNKDGKLLTIYYIERVYGTDIYNKTSEEYYEKLLSKDWKISVKHSFKGPTISNVIKNNKKRR